MNTKNDTFKTIVFSDHRSRASKPEAYYLNYLKSLSNVGSMEESFFL